MPAPLRQDLPDLSRDWKESALPEPPLATGVEELDHLLRGGMPRGKLVEITGPNSSGRTSLVCSVLRQAAAGGGCAAYVDAFDTFDPESARNAGVPPDAVLWVRCHARDGDIAVDRALKAADLLAQAGGFEVIVLDLAPVSWRPATRVPRIAQASWFRLQRAVKDTPSVLVALTAERLSGSAATLVLAMERGQVRWGDPRPAYQFEDRTPTPGGRPGNRFQGVDTQARLLKGAFHGGVSVHCRF